MTHSDRRQAPEDSQGSESAFSFWNKVGFTAFPEAKLLNQLKE